MPRFTTKFSMQLYNSIYKKKILYKFNFKKFKRNIFFFNNFTTYYYKNLLPSLFVKQALWNQNYSITSTSGLFLSFTRKKKYVNLLPLDISKTNTAFLYKMINHVFLQRGYLLKHQTQLKTANLVFFNPAYQLKVYSLIYLEQPLSGLIGVETEYSKTYNVGIIFNFNEFNFFFDSSGVTLISNSITTGFNLKRERGLKIHRPAGAHNMTTSVSYITLFLFFFAINTKLNNILMFRLLKLMTFLNHSILKLSNFFKKNLLFFQLLYYYSVSHNSFYTHTLNSFKNFIKYFNVKNTLFADSISKKKSIEEIYRNSRLYAHHCHHSIFNTYLGGMPFIFILKQCSLGRKLRKILKGTRRFKKILYFVPKLKRTITAIKQFRIYSQFLTKKSYVTRVLEQLVTIVFFKVKSPLYLSYFRQQINILGQLLKSKKRN